MGAVGPFVRYFFGGGAHHETHTLETLLSNPMTVQIDEFAPLMATMKNSYHVTGVMKSDDNMDRP
jgi:hypothetical protein